MYMPWLFAPLISVLSWLCFPFHSNSRVLLENQETDVSRILLLTAHPDDECLFFAPTVLALRDDPAHPEMYSLTISVGNVDGIGESRKDELSRSLDVMGIDQDKRWVVDHPMLQDNITLRWDASVIAVVIAPYVVNNRIDTILTFDTQGVSSHPNHCSLPFGALHLVDSLLSKASSTVPRVYSLVTVPLAPKYAGALALVSTRLSVVFERLSSYIIRNDRSPRAVFTSGFNEYMTAVRAMRKHTSQLVWFRYLYVTFSRYMWVNEWVEIKPADILDGASI